MSQAKETQLAFEGVLPFKFLGRDGHLKFVLPATADDTSQRGDIAKIASNAPSHMARVSNHVVGRIQFQPHSRYARAIQGHPGMRSV